MEQQYEATCNPWSTDDSAVGLRNALRLAEKTGHVLRHTEEYNKTKIDEMPSMEMIRVQKEISRLKAEMNKVNFEIQKRMLYHETKDITDKNVIEKRTGEVKKLLDHLQMVIVNKEFLITRLQQPHVGDFIKLEAAYHRQASELFSQLAPLLSDLTSHLDNLAWINANTYSLNQLDDLVAELSGVLASIQTQFQSLSQMSQCIHSLHSLDDSHNTSQ